MENKKRIAILGSTGSIGTQALDVIKRNADRFQVEVLTANNNADLLIEQALEFEPNCVVISNKTLYPKVKDALRDTFVKVFCGQEALEEVVAFSTVDMVLVALVGFSGLRPTISAIKAKKTIALANKETLVVAGELVTRLAAENKVAILPVDSEHSAIFQCLQGEMFNPIKRILLTASGGAFRGKKREDLVNIRPEDALRNPNWLMGKKVTIDSATLMNKGLEVIEAHWLFGVEGHDIVPVVHPQSIIHSMVEFEDGSIKAQMGRADMRIPILYALSYPERLRMEDLALDIFSISQLNFERPDRETFPCLNLAFEALEKKGNVPAIMNAANEIAVKKFLEEKIPFLQISDIITQAMSDFQYIKNPTLDDYILTDKEVREKLDKQY